MKKSFIGVWACLLFAGSVFAGPFGDLASSLNGLDGSKQEFVQGAIPEGQELFPVVYRYTHDKFENADKILDSSTVLDKANIVTGEYIVKTHVFFKFGLGYQCQDAVVTIKGEGDKFNVCTTSFITYSADKNGNRTGDALKSAARTMNANSKNVVKSIEDLFNSTKGDDYKFWEEQSYSDLGIQYSIAKISPNRLKAKKWYSEHSLIDKEKEINMYFTTLRESKKAGYAYELCGLVAGVPEVLIYFYSNNDSYLDTKDNTVIAIKGKIAKVSYSPDFEPDYKMSAIYVEE